MPDPNVVDLLRGRLAQAQEQVRRLETAISALEGAGIGGAPRVGRPAEARKRAGGRRQGPGRPRGAAAAGNGTGRGAARKAHGRRKGYKLSEETRAKMRAAQQARWAVKNAGRKK
jgi:hypothetical protein